jgi:hypothetical protein
MRGKRRTPGVERENIDGGSYNVGLGNYFPELGKYNIDLGKPWELLPDPRDVQHS